MTLHASGFNIICNRPGCGRLQTLADKTEARALDSAVKMGWVRVNGKDYCPFDAPAAKASQATP